MGSKARRGSPSADDGLGSASAAERGSRLNEEFFDLDFSVHKSRRYHEKLAGFYSRWRDRFRIITAVAGSAAFVLVIAETNVGKVLSGIVALWAALDIIIAPDKKAELHSDLCKRFTELARRLAETPQTESALKELRAHRLLIEENEPPCKRLVDLEARNDEWRSRGFPPDNLVPLSTWQRRLGKYFDFGLERLERWKAERQRAEAVNAA